MKNKSDFTVEQTKYGLTITQVNNSDIEILNVPEGITYIGSPDAIEYIFSKCKKLKEIYLPSTLKRIEMYAFNACKALEKINIPKSVEYIGANAFEDCSSLKEINIPDSVKSIGKGAFSCCSKLETIHLPKKITELPDLLFFACKKLNISALEIPAAVTRIGSRTFGFSEVESFVVPENITSIGDEAFIDCCKLKELIMPDSVVELGCNLFGQNFPKATYRISPNIIKTNVIFVHDSTYALFKLFSQYYKVEKNCIINLTLNKKLENETLGADDFE